MTSTTLAAALAAALAWAGGGTRTAAADIRWADSFDGVSGWRTVASDGVRIDATTDAGAAGRGLRIDYDFARGSGYGIVRHEFDPPLEVPENYRFRFHIRGEGPRNTLEFKLVEKTPGPDGAPGESVWWINQPDYAFPAEWTPVSMPKRKFGFAWGPSEGTPLKTIDALEIVVTSFSGGKGTVWVDELALEALPAVQPYAGTPSVNVSSRDDGQGPLAINNEGFLGWRSRSDDPAPAAEIDFGEPREFGGLVLEWDPQHPGRDYRVEAMAGETWTPIATVRGGNGGRDYLVTPDTVTPRVRIAASSPGPIGLRSVRVLEPAFADSPNRLFEAVAADAPRGWYPRYWLGEGTYWTVIGADGDHHEALISEDGAIELVKQGPSVEPFIVSGGRLLTWNQAETAQTLEDGYLPIPRVRRAVSAAGGDVGLALEVLGFADDAPPLARGRGVLWMRYTLTNTGTTPHAGTLYLAARPMQVNPTYQFLNTVGGVGRLGHVRADARGLELDGRRLTSLSPVAAMAAAAFEHGEIVEHIAAGRLPDRAEAIDPAGLASGALAYPFDLAPGESLIVRLAWPLAPDGAADPLAAMGLAPGDPAAADAFDRRLAAVKAEWKATLNRVEVRLPGEAQRWWDAARSNVAYVLINRDGPAIQPGSRSYERTWIRDGSLTSSALLALGHDREVREFLDWFAPFQYDNGKIPCCVDRRGPDPVPEHDSHGQYIYSVMNLYRYTGDGPLLRQHWDRVLAAVSYIEHLRAQRLTDEFRLGPDEKRVLYGLLPESISHEGYSAKPMHSYWDDFWALKGLEDAAEMARVLGEEAQASRLEGLRDSFRVTLYDSIRLAMKLKGIDYIPGCAELGDFDATSTTIGVWPCDELGNIPEPQLTNTFERYWQYVSDRRAAAGQAEKWVNYTPYEWRTIGTMIRLGERGGDWRARAHELAEFFFADSRPAGWNHWAEVVWRDPRHAGFIGDMPHTWVGSDFINAFRSMIAYENDRERTMVLGAGIPLSWLLSDEGVSVKNLRTHFGALSLATRREGPRVIIEIGGGLRMPEGGLTLSLPEPDLIRAVRVDGADASWNLGRVRLPRVPVNVEVEYGTSR